MPKKKSTNSNSFRFADGLVSAVCLAVALACLVFFYLDLTNTLSRLGEQPVGTISWKYKAAQRRFTDRVLWDRLRMNAPVYDGDLIRTASLSEASVTFSEGGIIDLAENSLVRIFAKDALPRIELVGGNVSAAAGEGGIVLVSGDRELFLNAGGTADILGGEDAAFLVTGGTGTLFSSGDVRELQAGDAAGFRSGTEALAVVVSPPANARFLSPDPAAWGVDFVWNGVNYGPEDHTRIEVAYDRGFTRPAASLEVPGGESRARVELAPGVYFWRVYASRASSGPASVVQTSRLTVFHAPPPGLITPVAGRSYPYDAETGSLRFRWTNSADSSASDAFRQDPDPDYYLLEAADNPDMTNPALRLRTRGTQTESPLPGPGRWYWRVSAWYGEASRISETAPFVLEPDTELASPVLVVPAADGEVDLDPRHETVYFSWKTVKGAASYTLTVSPNQDMSAPLITRQVRENYYGYSVSSGILKQGRYYWTVSASGGGNTVSASSRTFSVREDLPDIRMIFPPDGYTAAAELLPDIRFTWKTDLSPVRFQVAPDQAFAAPVMDEPATGNFQGRPLPEGLWYWRVVSGGTQSPVRRFTVTGILPPPVLAEETRDLLLRPGENAVFRWQPVEEAAYYRFRLYGNGGALLYSADAVPDTSVSVSLDGYPEGDYRWTVQAFAGQTQSSSRRSGRPDSGSFYLDRYLELLSPAANQVFEAIRLRETGFIVFSWDEAPEIPEYTFFLHDEDQRQILSRTVSRPSYVLEDLGVLGRGVFIWRVEGGSGPGPGRILSPERRFRIDIPAVKQAQFRDIGTLYGKE
jgi:hypothetical protein